VLFDNSFLLNRATLHFFVEFMICVRVRRNMDSVAICMLRRAICILQKFLCNMDNSSKPFLFRRNESILHLDPYCRAIYGFFFLITDKNRKKPTYWACQVKLTSSQWIIIVMLWRLVCGRAITLLHRNEFSSSKIL
jgi:hypothetical protein